MKERPILLKGGFVSAILNDEKTETRRPVKVDLPDRKLFTVGSYHDDRGELLEFGFIAEASDHCSEFSLIVKPEYGVSGDRLWVRETWRPTGSSMPTGWKYEWRATAKKDGTPEDGPWKPSIHMPRKACRLVLEILSISVERLHDITEEDARAEGVFTINRSYVKGFKHEWEKIYGPCSWKDNPFVWVIKFKPVNEII